LELKKKSMLRSKTFTKKTRKGNVVNVVREHYLRDDIACGAPACKACLAQKVPVLGEKGLSTPLFPAQHYLLPDTNIAIHQVPQPSLRPLRQNEDLDRTLCERMRARAGLGPGRFGVGVWKAGKLSCCR
jgi:exosome complex exonuclease DIS3/RRP44